MTSAVVAARSQRDLPDSEADVPPPRRYPDWARALALYGTLKLIGFGVFMYLLSYAGDFRQRHPRMDARSHVWDVLASWDGWWYQQVAEHGYDPKLVPIPGGAPHWTVEQNSAAFFPLYPALMRLVSTLTGLGSFGSGLVVSVAASFAAAGGIYATARWVAERWVAERRVGVGRVPGGAVAGRVAGPRSGLTLPPHRSALCATALWAVWPGSGVEWAVYSDALYSALAVWTCHAVLTRRWLLAGVLCLAAGLARPSALALIVTVVITALVAAHRGPDGVRRPLTAAALAPLGFLGYLTWVGLKAGNPRAFFILESDAWNHYLDFGGQTLHATRSILIGRADYDFANPVEDLVALAALLLSLVLLATLLTRRPPLVLALFATLSLALMTASHQIFGDLSRYLLPVFPLLLPAADALATLRPPPRATLLTLTALASGSYAGYILFELGIP